MTPHITKNPDGTFRIEMDGLHFSRATLAEAIGWLVELLVEMEPEAK